MSKRQPQKPSRQAQKPAAASPRPAAKKKTPGMTWPLYAPPPDASTQSPRLRQWWLAAVAFSFLVLAVLAFNSGINEDDKFQEDYAERLVNYYTTFGKDRSVFYEADADSGYKKYAKYYGGVFDLTTGLVNRALGFQPEERAYHHVRHLFNAGLGGLLLLFASLLVRDIAGYRAALIALLLMLASPTLVGHAMMNSKDIPFAAGYMISVYYLYRCLKTLPDIGWRDGLGFILGAALTIGTRAGGILVLAYAALFMGLNFVMKHGLGGLVKETKIVGKYAMYFAGGSLAAFLLAILFWPSALVSPIAHTREALALFTKFDVSIKVLFQGDNIPSSGIPKNYAPTWIFNTLTIPLLLGWITGIFIVIARWRKLGFITSSLILFACFFPPIYIIYKNSPLYDGWRHLMFIFGPLAVIAALFWDRLFDLVSRHKIATWALAGLFAIGIAEPAFFIIKNSYAPYVYFNPLAGGMKGAFGQYETDYWGLSVRPAISWMEKEGILSADNPDTVVIGTNFYYNFAKQLKEEYRGKVKVRYARFDSRYSEPWDYGVFVSRFIKGRHLRAGSWPTSKTIHTISANGVPLAAIERDTAKLAYKGNEALKVKNWDQAIADLSEETRRYPDNEVAWMSLANAYINAGNAAAAVMPANEALKLSPENTTALYYLGLAQLNLGDKAGAMSTFERGIKADKDFYLAHYYIAYIHTQNNQPSEALQALQKAITAEPSFKAAYELAANIYQQQGDEANAQRFFEAASKLK
jgi:Tfp pilus assembly protein PilF